MYVFNLGAPFLENTLIGLSSMSYRKITSISPIELQSEQDSLRKFTVWGKIVNPPVNISSQYSWFLRV
jgi:hypothetical protein